MTVKTTLALLLLTCLALSAQTTPNEDAPVSPDEVAKNAARLAAGTTNTTVVKPATPEGGLPPFPVSPTGTRRARGDAGRAVAPAAPGAVPVPAGAIPVANPPLSAAPALAANGSPAVPAATAPKPAEEVTPAGLINLTGADLNQMLTEYSRYVGRSILRSPTLPPNVNFFFVNQTPLTKSEVIQAYQALFAMNSISLIEVGEKFLKAVPAAEAIQQGQKPLIFTNAADLPELGQYVTHIVQLKYVKPTEMIPVLTPFQKMANAIYPIDSSQILVIRDYTENVKRMLEMIEKVDVTYPSEFDSEVIPIKFAKAEDIASALNSLSGSGGGSATTVGARASGSGGASRAGSRPGMGGYQQGAPGTMGQQGALGGANPTGTPSGGGSFSDRINQIINRAATGKATGSGDFQIIGPNKIVADVRSNSLMVFASRNDMLTIKKIISQLDVVLAQVLIETIILDVQLGNAWNFGVQAGQQPNQFNKTFTGGGTLNNAKNPLGTGTAFLNQMMQTFTTNFVGGVTNITSAFTPNPNIVYPDSGGLSYYGKLAGSLNWDVMVQAAASDSRVNVVQRPQIQTSHATPGRIFIGKTVPYVSGSYYGGGYGGGNSYQQMRVGISLDVTPYINQDGLVVMQIEESIDEISGSTTLTGVGDVPNTTSRTISAEVAVRDRETIILGGFVRNSETLNRSGVPFLKDIPLLGALFTSRGTAKDRSELMVLMRPTVLRTPQAAALQVAVEKQRMPGAMRAEVDNEKAERRAVAQEAAVEKAEKRAAKKAPPVQFDKGTPFTPEEKELYGKPDAAKP
jgi:general secretion pathway protein D